MTQSLKKYLEGLATPEDGVCIHASEGYGWGQHDEASIHAIVLEDASAVGEAYRVLKPGGHLFLIAPDEEPTGHTGASEAEALGFEVRDAIFLAQEGSTIHYAPKASRSEREEGLTHLPVQTFGMSRGARQAIEDGEDYEFDKPGTVGMNRVQQRRNIHPTVKPVEVMEKVLDGVEGVVLDPFMGSGTTMIACLATGHDGIGIEKSEEYHAIADSRVRHWNQRSAAWDSAAIKSDREVVKVEAPEVSMGEFFGFTDD